MLGKRIPPESMRRTFHVQINLGRLVRKMVLSPADRVCIYQLLV